MTDTEFLIPKRFPLFIPVLIMSFILLTGTTDAIARQLSEGQVSDSLIIQTHPIYDIYKNRYDPDAKVIQQLQQHPELVDIRVFFGEWCHDSKREIPRLLKVISLIENPNLKIRYHHIAREDYKVGDIYTEWSFQYTPTILFFKNEEEIGRIEEEPLVSIETDMLNILQQKKNSEN